MSYFRGFYFGYAALGRQFLGSFEEDVCHCMSDIKPGHSLLESYVKSFVIRQETSDLLCWQEQLKLSGIDV